MLASSVEGGGGGGGGVRAHLGSNQSDWTDLRPLFVSWSGCYWKAWVHAPAHRHGELQNSKLDTLCYSSF